MFTEEKILCGTKQELTDYIYETYKLVPRTEDNAYKPNTNFDGFELGTVRVQLDKIDTTDIKTGLVFFLSIKETEVDELDNVPTVNIEFEKIWVHIRKSTEIDKN